MPTLRSNLALSRAAFASHAVLSKGLHGAARMPHRAMLFCARVSFMHTQFSRWALALLAFGTAPVFAGVTVIDSFSDPLGQESGGDLGVGGGYSTLFVPRAERAARDQPQD